MTVANAPRMALGFPFAALITLALAMLMQMLITNREPAPEPPVPQEKYQITSDIVDTPPVVRDWPEAPEEIVTPRWPDIRTVEPTDGVEPGIGGQVGPPTVLSTNVNIGASIQMLTPLRRIVAVPPEYPPIALRRELEGSCVVLFDVGITGLTQNVRSGACTDHVFASASERAVRRFRYAPRQGEFGPEVVTGMRYEVVFQFKD